VEDNGPESAHEMPTRRFDPFFTNEAPRDERDVGLAIAFGIIREHYGVLELEGDSEGIRHRVRIQLAIS
jgi:C4-dicarboxylate-specific signal transduction histidine kinase